MKIKIKNLVVGDKFKYDVKSPEFEIFSLIISCPEFCLAKNLETLRIMQHSVNCEVYVPPYDDLCIQLTLF